MALKIRNINLTIKLVMLILAVPITRNILQAHQHHWQNNEKEKEKSNVQNWQTLQQPQPHQ